MDRLSASVRASLESFRLGRHEAWESLAEPTPSNGYASLHSVTYEYFSAPEQTSARQTILGLLGRLYHHHCENLPQKQKSGLTQASRNWNVTIWHFFLALGPDILRSRESCLAIVRMSKRKNLDFHTCIAQIHAQRKERLKKIARSTSLDTAGKVKPADIIAAESADGEEGKTLNASDTDMASSPILGAKASRARKHNSDQSILKATATEGWRLLNRKNNVRDAGFRAEEAGALKEFDPANPKGFEDAMEDEDLEGDTLIDMSSEKGRRSSRGSNLVIQSTPEPEELATRVEPIKDTRATSSRPTRKRPMPIFDVSGPPSAKRARSNDEDEATLINSTTVPLEQLVLGVRSLEGDSWANDTAVSNTIRKLRAKDCYVLDSLFLAGTRFLRRTPTERYFVAPVNIRNMHWALYFWDTKLETIEYYDSMKHSNLHCKDRLLSIINSAFKPARMPEIQVCKAFQQRNNNDCGPLAILNAFQKRLGIAGFVKGDDFDSKNVRTYFQRLLLTSLDAAPPGFAEKAGVLTSQETSRGIFDEMKAVKLQGRLRKVVQKDFLLQANLTWKASNLVKFHEAHRTLVHQAYEQSLQARDVRDHELRRLQSLKDYVSSLPTDTLEQTSSATVFGPGLDMMEKMARDNLGRMLPAAEKMAIQSGPLSWAQDRPITRSILMLRHLGRQYSKAERALCDFRGALEGLA
uniref:Sentrin-specific protease 2-like protein n=1 Tax=Colletotrichum fructicola (strain Nara gc5) TaxID=1213859 RepID=L2GK17_COLFN